MTHQALSALALAAGLAVAPAALAQTLSWSNAGGGSAAVGRNWNPVQIPGPNNDLEWSLTAAYGVSFSSGVPASLSHAFHRGTVTLTMISPHTVGSGGVAVAGSFTDDADVLLASGVWNVAGPFSVSGFLNTSGALTVTGADSDLNLTGASPLTIGVGGSAALDILNLASVTVADRLLLANGVNAITAARVSGSQFVVPFTRSSLAVLGSGESRIGGAGDAALRIDAGAQASFAGSLVIANASTSVSSITVENPAVVSPRLIVGADLSIGRNLAAGSAAGAGSLILSNGGQAQIAGTIHLGDDPDGGSGLLRLTSTSCLATCRGLTLGAAADLDIQAGEVRIDGGALDVNPGRLLPLDGPAAGHGILSLINGASFVEGSPVQLGIDGFMEIRLSSGSSLRTVGAGVFLGINNGSAGSLSVSGAGTTLDVASMRVGSHGYGVLFSNTGAVLSVSDMLEVGALSDGVGVVDIHGGALSIGQDLVLAGRSTGPGSAVAGGHATFTIGPSGSVTVGGGVVGLADSTLTIDGGTLTAVNDVSVRSTLIDGVINARSFSSLTPFNASGRINARISGADITAAGDLTLGNGASDAISNLTLNVGAHRVDLLDPFVAEVRDVTINGGTLSSSDRIQVVSTLQGTGTILGMLVNDGATTSTGPLGLRFGGTLINPPGGTLSGTKLTFLPGASFQGVPNGGGKWRIEAGASALFTFGSTGMTFIGAVAPDGFSCDGQLFVSADVGIGDSDGFDVGPDCTLNNAVLAGFTGPFSPNAPISVGRSGAVLHELRGAGTIVGSSVTNSGRINPGFGGDSLAGRIDITGSYFQGQGPNAGTLEFDINGITPEQADMLTVSLTAVMDGTVRVRTAFGFHPPIGFRRTLLQAGAILGGIPNLVLPPQWRLERTATTLEAVFCPPDFNNDGFVDFFDYDDFVNCFESGQCPPGSSADFNDDGFADFFDYDDFVQAFEHGC